MAPANEMRQRKAGKSTEKEVEPNKDTQNEPPKPKDEKKSAAKKSKKAARPRWNCYDALCWMIGNLTVLFLILFVSSKFVPSKKAAEYVIEKITGAPPPQQPGQKLREEGLKAKHPLVFMPGVVTGGLELWEGHECAEDLFRQRVWGGDFADKVLSKPHCWMDHLILDNETGLDPPNVRVRSVPGLVAADFFMPGYFVWAPIIESAARLGYDHKNMWMADYDWRLSFGNTEKRDRTLTRLKMVIETTIVMNEGQKVVLVPHSMGCVYVMYFLKWVEAPAPLGGGGGPHWVNDHIHAVAGIAGPWLGVAKGVTGFISAEAKDVAEIRAMAPLLDSAAWGTRAFQHVLRVSRTWESLASMLPKGGTAIWGDVDWSPEEGYECAPPKKEEDGEFKDKDVGKSGKPVAHYGRFLSFGRELAELEKGKVKETVEKMLAEPLLFVNNTDCRSDVWTEYQNLSTDKMQEIARRGVYNVEQVLDMLREIAPNLMARADENWGFGVADDPSAPEYADKPKYWSNPLETTLPIAPDMTIYALQGVGIPTERSYIMKLSDLNESCALPFRIDGTVSGKNEGCLKSGAQFSDGDITINLLSAGYMAAKGWKGRTKFNPGGVKAVMREYKHVAPANLLEGRGTQSGNHVDIMGNYAMIEDILRIATGATADEVSDRYYSKLPEWVDRVKIDVGLKEKSSFAQKLGLRS